MTKVIDELIRHSVTKDEQVEAAGLMRIHFTGLVSDRLVHLPYELPRYWVPERDRVLRSTVRKCGLWGTSVNIAAARVASMGYKIDNDVTLRVKRAREAVGRNWVQMINRTCVSWAANDNGAFLEIVRASNAAGSRVLGFLPLSTVRCIRTGDPNRPVLYVDRLGRYHEMKRHQVVAFSDMPNEDIFDIGISASSRAYEDIYEHLAINAFFKEKATGKRPLAVDLIKGFSKKKVDEGILSAEANAKSKGYTTYMGAAIIADTNTEGGALSHVRIPFADLPSWFSQKEHEDLTRVRFAAHLGIDASELDPRLQSKAMGSGAQAAILDEKQDGKGFIILRQQLAEFFNDTQVWHPLPGRTTFAFAENDLRDQKSRADIAATRAGTRATQIASGEISVDEARQIAVDAGDLPDSFIQVDKTDEDTLTDEDKANATELPIEAEAGATPEEGPDPAADAAITSGVQQLAAKMLHRSKASRKRFKAGETLLATYAMPPTQAESQGVIQSESGKYWRQVTRELRELGQLWEIAANAEIPQREGEMATTIKSRITSPGTSGVTLKLYVGGKSRPEVAVRAVLFGRKGFGPKRAKALRFQVNGKNVFARSVKGVATNDWFARSMSTVKPALKAMESRLGKLSNPQTINVRDIDGAHVYRVAQPAPKMGKKR